MKKKIPNLLGSELSLLRCEFCSLIIIIFFFFNLSKHVSARRIIGPVSQLSAPSLISFQESRFFFFFLYFAQYTKSSLDCEVCLMLKFLFWNAGNRGRRTSQPRFWNAKSRRTGLSWMRLSTTTTPWSPCIPKPWKSFSFSEGTLSSSRLHF